MNTQAQLEQTIKDIEEGIEKCREAKRLLGEAGGFGYMEYHKVKNLINEQEAQMQKFIKAKKKELANLS